MTNHYIAHCQTADKYMQLSAMAFRQHDHIRAMWYADKAEYYRVEAKRAREQIMSGRQIAETQ